MKSSPAGLAMLALVLAPALALAGPPRWQTLPMPPAMPPAVTTGHVASDGVPIYYATYGRGAPVILLHGGLGNSDHWAFQVPALARRHRVIVIDSRHQGRSGFSTRKLSYRAMAGDVLRVMDALGIASAAIVGWSDGGQIALELAIHHPARVAKLFVFGAMFDARGSKPRRARSSTFDAYAARCRRDFRKLAKDPSRYADVVASLRPLWRSSPGLTRAQLGAIAAPTVVALGAHDELIRVGHARQMARRIPGAKLVIFEDASHFALWQDPEGFTRAVLDFLGPDAPGARPRLRSSG